MKKLLVLMLAMLTAVTSPEQFKVNYIPQRDLLQGDGRTPSNS